MCVYIAYMVATPGSRLRIQHKKCLLSDHSRTEAGRELPPQRNQFVAAWTKSQWVLKGAYEALPKACSGIIFNISGYFLI